jgi:hypothetical protein
MTRELSRYETKMKFRVNDRVQILGDWKKIYTIVAIRKREPCCQIRRVQRGKRMAGRKWMMSDNLDRA